MNIQHQELKNGRWNQLSLVEQMAHVGSEVERALLAKEKNNSSRMNQAFERALELLDFSLEAANNRTRLKEIARTREVIADYFLDDNQFNSSSDFLRKYFLQFALAARKNI